MWNDTIKFIFYTLGTIAIIFACFFAGCSVGKGISAKELETISIKLSESEAISQQLREENGEYLRSIEQLLSAGEANTRRAEQAEKRAEGFEKLSRQQSNIIRGITAEVDGARGENKELGEELERCYELNRYLLEKAGYKEDCDISRGGRNGSDGRSSGIVDNRELRGRE